MRARRLLSFLLIVGLLCGSAAAGAAAPPGRAQAPSKKKRSAKKKPAAKKPSRPKAGTVTLPVETRLEWNALKMRAPAPALRTLREGPADTAAGAARGKTNSGGQDLLENRGVVMDLEDGWRLRLSVDSRPPSALGDHASDPRLLGLETVGPTVTWERKF